MKTCDYAVPREIRVCVFSLGGSIDLLQEAAPTIGTCHDPIALLEELGGPVGVRFLQKMVQSPLLWNSEERPFFRMIGLGKLQICHIRRSMQDPSR